MTRSNERASLAGILEGRRRVTSGRFVACLDRARRACGLVVGRRMTNVARAAISTGSLAYGGSKLKRPPAVQTPERR